ncbi:hypothetical protein [Croceicoccus naphthovorans]|nr:hypothetical protein [Croceicoccus naphthovorans]
MTDHGYSGSNMGPQVNGAPPARRSSERAETMAKEQPDTPYMDASLPLLAGWIEFWMMPVTMMARMMGMTSPVADDEPEIDRKCAHKQLPVPNAHQKDMDHDLFA